MDDGRLGNEMTLAAIANRLDTISSDITAVRSDIKSLDGKVGALDHKMKIEFEAIRSVVKLGFENVQMLDERIERRFDTTDRANEDNKSLLEAALVSLRGDLEKAKQS